MQLAKLKDLVPLEGEIIELIIRGQIHLDKATQDLYEVININNKRLYRRVIKRDCDVIFTDWEWELAS